MPNNVVLSKMVLDARKKLDISQRELARRTGIDNAEISRIEKGTRQQPNILAIKALANVLVLDYKKLLKAAGYSKEDIDQVIEPNKKNNSDDITLDEVFEMFKNKKITEKEFNKIVENKLKVFLNTVE